MRLFNKETGGYGECVLDRAEASMAEDLALEPQLKEFLLKTNLIRKLGDDSGIPDEQLRALYAAAFM